MREKRARESNEVDELYKEYVNIAYPKMRAKYEANGYNVDDRYSQSDFFLVFNQIENDMIVQQLSGTRKYITDKMIVKDVAKTNVDRVLSEKEARAYRTGINNFLKAEAEEHKKDKEYKSRNKKGGFSIRKLEQGYYEDIVNDFRQYMHEHNLVLQADGLDSYARRDWFAYNIFGSTEGSRKGNK